MPLGKAVPRLLMALAGLVAAACSSAPAPEPVIAPVAAPIPPPTLAENDLGGGSTARIPREVLVGAVDMVIQRVEQNVSRAEVAAAIAPMIAIAPVCLRWPTLWIEQARRGTFVVRYDLMARDWGQPAAAGAEARMEEFVAMGFLQRQNGANAQVVTYVVTQAGEPYLSGALEPGRRPSFCAPAERRLVAIEAMEWGQYPCGTLHVRFTHEGDALPAWVRADATRARLEQGWPQAGTPVNGEVSLSRQWFRRQNLPPGAENGRLTSACYDARRQEIIGDDLNLSLRVID
jgi:hypothetical protein